MNVNKNRKNAINICLLLTDYYKPGRPALSEIFEIYYEELSRDKSVRITWMVPSTESSKKIVDNNIQIILINKKESKSIIINRYYEIIYSIKLLLEMNKNKKNISIVQSRDNAIFGLVGIIFGKINSIPVIFNHSFNNKLYKTHPSIIFRLFGRIENKLLEYILKTSDYIFPVSTWMEDEIHKKGIVTKTHPLYIGVNTDRFSTNIDGNIIRNKYNLHNSIVLVYTGTMDGSRGLECLLSGFADVCCEQFNIKLMMVGGGNAKEKLIDLSIKIGITENIIFTGEVDYFDVPKYIAASDIGISIIKPHETFMDSSPTKIFEYFAMKKPVIANLEIPEQKKVIDMSCGGIAVHYDPQQISNAIKYLCENKFIRERMGNNGRKWVSENRSYKNMAPEILKIYLELLDGI